MEQVNKTLGEWADNTVVEYPITSLLLIVALSVVVVLMVMGCGKKEGFMPTSLSSQQQSDSLGMGLKGQAHHDYAPNYGSEHATADRSTSVFAQQVQTDGNMAYGAVVATAGAGAPGSQAYQILHSPNYGCDTRIPMGDDAYAWVNKELRSDEGFKGKNANQLSATLQGY